MTRPLSDVLAEAKHVLLDFDGPICSIFGGLSAPSVATHLKGMISEKGVMVPKELADSDDPFDVLRFIANCAPDLAAQVESELHEMELRATQSAIPTPGAHEVIKACKQTGRTVSAVSNNSLDAVTRYLTDHDLVNNFTIIVGRTAPDPTLLKPNPKLILDAVNGLSAEPSACVLVGDSLSDIDGARNAGTLSIGYANKPGKAPRLTAAGADSIITSMAELAQSMNSHD